MYNKILLLLLFLFTGNMVFCQLRIDWQQSYGGLKDEYACNMLKLHEGYMVIGTTLSDNSSVSFNHGGFDIWIIKIDDSGNIVWEKTLGGKSEDYARSAFWAADSSGIFIFGGSSSIDGDITNDPFPGIYNNWLLKISEAGDIIWGKKFGTPNGTNSLKSGEPTNDGGLIISANISESGGCVTDYYGNKDAWIAKISSVGDIEWERTVGSSGFEQINSVIPVPDGGYITSIFGWPNDSTGNVNCSITNYTDDAIIFKFDHEGNEVWQHCYGGSSYDYINSIAPVDDGYLVAGMTDSFDRDLENAGYHDKGDIWLFKVDLSGNLLWSKCYGGYSYEGIKSVYQADDGNFLVFGITESNDGDVIGNNTYSEWGPSIWIFKINGSGQMLWQQVIGGVRREYLGGVNNMGSGKYAISGLMEYSPSCDVNCSNFILGTEDNLWQFVITDLTDSTLIANKLPEMDMITLYPNPADFLLYFQSKETSCQNICRIELVDVSGRILISESFSSGHGVLDVHEIDAGIYYIRYSIIDKVGIKKVLIK